MSNARLIFIRVIIIVLGIVLAVRLYNLQIINGEAYLQASNSRSTTTIAEKAPRGDIKDRNGKTLVTNREA